MEMMWASPQVDETRCTRCGLCVEACRCQAIELGTQGPVFSCPEVSSCSMAELGAADCSCVCEDVCPTGAINWAFEIVLGGDRAEEQLPSA